MRMPASLTQEMESARNQLEQAVDAAPSFNKTRELILERLGGAYDYNQYAEDLRQIKTVRDHLRRTFKSQQLLPPELNKSDFGGKKAFYDFSVRPMIDPLEQRMQELRDQTIVSYQKPDHLKSLRTERPKFMIADDFSGLVQEKPQPQTMKVNVPPTSVSAPPPQSLEPMVSQPQPVPKQEQPPPEPKPLDLLTLKKQVMEEIRQELEREAKEKYERDERAHQALMAQRERDLQKKEIAMGGQAFPESKMDTQIVG